MFKFYEYERPIDEGKIFYFGGGGGGGDGGAAAREAARKARVDKLKSGIRGIFYAPQSQVDVPAKTFGDVRVQRGQEQDSQGDYGPRFVTEQGITNQAAIDAANAQNRILSDQPTAERQARFADIESRTRDFFTPNFRQDVGDARRELGFALARRGTYGGSAQIDAESRLEDKIRAGEREIGQRAIGARTEASRLDNLLLTDLLNQANQDGSLTGLLANARSGQISSIDTALAGATRNQIEDQFTNVGTLFKDINDAAAFSGAAQQSRQLAALLGQNQNPFIRNTSRTGGGTSTLA